MSNQTNPAPKNKQAEAEEYLKKHKIAELFDNITAHLVFNQPENSKESILEYLEGLRKSKLANLNPPTLIEEKNLQSIFGMLDPSSQGFINYSQYVETMKSLGINDYEKNIEGKNIDKIKLDAFLRETKKSLNKVNATFKPK